MQAAGHPTGTIHQTEEGAKAWGVYAWLRNCKTMATLPGIPKPSA